MSSIVTPLPTTRGPLARILETMRFKYRSSAVTAISAGVLLLLLAAGCNGPAPAPDAGTANAAPAAQAPDVAPDPALVFINLLPWGQVDFSRGRFPTMGDCNRLVRSLPNYSFYTTPERCESIEDPVYCTAWQDPGEPGRLDCFKGVGGCDVELKRHDLLAESGGRTVTARCEPSSLADAWTRYQPLTAPGAGEPAPATTPR